MTTDPKSTKNSKDINIIFSLIVELLFTLLPFIVYGVVLSYKGQPSLLLEQAEWSVAATVLFGQVLVKLISGIIASKIEATEQRVALISALLIVVGLVPSVLVLTLILYTDKPSSGLVRAQVTLFILAVVSFIAFGGEAENMRNRKRNAHNEPEKGEA